MIKKIIVIVVIALIGFFIYQRTAGSTSQVQYQTAQVTRGSIISSVSESGNVAAAGEVNVSSPTDGVIQAIYVKNGDNVKAGQNLFQVKSTATPQEQAAAYASYLGAETNLQSAQAKMNSLQAALFSANQAFVTDKGQGNPSTAEQADPKYIEEDATWLQAEADYKNQQGVIQQAQVAANSAWLAYAATQDSTVTAPVDGTVANLAVAPGSTVTGSTTTTTTNTTTSTSSTSNTTGSIILVLGNFSSLQIVVPVSEVDVPQIKTGQKATISLDAFPNKTFVGTVTSVDSIGTTTSGVVNYNVYVTFLYPPNGVQAGMSATVNIETARADNVLYVPSAAVQTDSSGQTYVRMLANGNVTQVPVTTGISDDTNTAITSGLSEGQTVVTGVTTTAASATSSPFSGLTGARGGVGGGGATFRVGGGGGGGGGTGRGG